jgi:hypothetical protein
MGLFGRRRGGRVIEPESIVITKEILAIPPVVTKELLATPIVDILKQCQLKTTGVFYRRRRDFIIVPVVNRFRVDRFAANKDFSMHTNTQFLTCFTATQCRNLLSIHTRAQQIQTINKIFIINKKHESLKVK